MRYHFFLDTNFLLDFPEFPTAYIFDTKPYVLVICKPVLRELDLLKDEDLHSETRNYGTARSYKARQATRSIEAVLSKDVLLPYGGRITIYKRRVRAETADDEIALLAEKYAEEHPGDRVVLLTSDVNLRVRAYSQLVHPQDPFAWLELKIREHYAIRQYEIRVQRAIAADEQLKLLHQRRLEIEREIERAYDTGGVSDRRIAQLYESLAEVKEQELHRLERYEEEERKRWEEEQRRREEERRRREEEERKRREEEERRQRVERRNKAIIGLADLSTPSGRVVLPVETADFEKIGEVSVYRYWWYVGWNRYDLICTIHIEASITNQHPKLIILSALPALKYQPQQRYKLITSIPAKPVTVLLDGNWGLELHIEKWQVNPTPRFYRQYGVDPVFADLRFAIRVFEISDEEKARLLFAIEEEQKRSQMKQKEQEQRRNRSIFIFGVVLAALILLIVLCVLCNFLSVLLSLGQY